MSVTAWVVIAIMVTGIVIASFGLDRYRGSPEEHRWQRHRT